MAIILVVDDEDILLRNISRYLTGLGHHVRTASSGRDAMVLLDEPDIDLLITDINMPDVDGIAVLNSLRSREPKPAVIAMSGGGVLDKELLLASAGLLGAAETLDKPFELQDLRQAVERVLA